ncbi:MAG: PqqD family protein [Acidimicrobiales bacterium]
MLLALDTGRYYALNEVGSTVWALCDGTTTLLSVVDTVSAQFDAPADVVEADVLELVGELVGEGLLVEAD